MTNPIGNENPVMEAGEDRYGYDELAGGLARRLLALEKTSGTVIGIEGKWGSGKTSLLNLLLKHLDAEHDKDTHILPVSPWLSPPDTPMIHSLLLPVAAILDELDSRSYSALRKKLQWVRKIPASPLAKSLLDYTQQASGRLAPLAEFGGNFIPGLGIVSQGMETVSKLDLSVHRDTTEQLRRRIEDGISKSGLRFIVIIDDLDRLEPAQAVDVLRMVKAVAGFSGFHYILCYDPGVLSHAVEQELKVSDGRLFLQKIIPLSFSLPHHESFDLQRELLRGTLELYEQVNNDIPSEAEHADLHKAALIYGQELTTPREVSLVLSALAFRYADIRDYVYFPDLCLLQLVRVTNPGLYDWIEKYLTKYFVSVSGELSFTDAEQNRLKEELKINLAQYVSPEPGSLDELGGWVPGIVELADETYLFNRDAEVSNESRLNHKRLGSTAYWRYYFAFSAPQNVLPPHMLDELLFRFGIPEEWEILAFELLSSIREISLTQVTWYDHILSRLTARRTATLSFKQCEGLLWFFFNFSDQVNELLRAKGRYDSGNATGLQEVCNLLIRILSLHRQRGLWLLRKLFLEGDARGWLAQCMRDLLWAHGIRGNRPWEKEEQFLSGTEVESLREALAIRMSSKDMLNAIFSQQDLCGYLYSWRDIDSNDQVSVWITQVTLSNDGFVNLLYGLRGYAWNSVIKNHRSLRTDNIEPLLGPISTIIDRLKELCSEPRLSAMSEDLLKALQRSNRGLII
ncbi:KAP family NTPase [Citrobacter sp. Cpo109]|uniref:KAP family P-loop NTPase fold protein n=1 Tax=Citrobacter TaxID=544 RepID=UPI0025765A24|nr:MULTISPECIES: P-loop NTPase fold protein [Citrobacter]MDM2803521.1 KAP family NTPase [Citrobacter sp. Cpo109]MEB1114911.1 P-loop NTPase fold protein [Citrobacter portucalensis]